MMPSIVVYSWGNNVLLKSAAETDFTEHPPFNLVRAVAATPPPWPVLRGLGSHFIYRRRDI